MRFDAEERPARRLLPLQLGAPDIEAWLLAKDPVAIGRFDELGRDEYARSFTAARTAGADVIDDLYFGIVDTISRGGTEDDFAKLVTPILKRKGWLEGDDGAIGNRIRLIYDTNLRMARAAGRWDRYWASRSAFPYLRGITAEDERVRHPPHSPNSDHRAWDGIILPIEHPFWQEYGIGSWAWRCRCGTIQMTRSQLARYKSGVTSEADLEARKAKLGPPVFVSPAAGIGAQLRQAVSATNAGPAMPGRPPVDPVATTAAGHRQWEAERQAETRRRVDADLARIGLGVSLDLASAASRAAAIGLDLPAQSASLATWTAYRERVQAAAANDPANALLVELIDIATTAEARLAG